MGIGFAIPVSTAQAGDGAASSSDGSGHARLDRRRAAGADARDGRVVRLDATSRRDDRRRAARRPGRQGGHQARRYPRRINDDTITDTTRLLNVVAQIKPGTAVKVHLMRKNKELDVNVMIGKRPAQPRAPQLPEDDQGDQGEE